MIVVIFKHENKIAPQLHQKYFRQQNTPEPLQDDVEFH